MYGNTLTMNQNASEHIFIENNNPALCNIILGKSESSLCSLIRVDKYATKQNQISFDIKSSAVLF